MASLNEALSTMRVDKEAVRDPAATAIMNRSTDELRASGIMDRVLGTGDTAPMFARPNLAGETIRLRSVLKDGPAVVSFFRGRW